jgi:hypothetical protein
LKILEHLFEIAFDSAFAFTRLIVPLVGDQLLVLPDAIWDSILTNLAGSFAELVGRLLAVLAHASGRLVDVALQACDLIRKRLFALANLLLLLFAGPSGVAAARKLIHTPRNFFLTLQRIFSLLSKLLNILFSARALR